jgi:flagellar protein FliO/FliZ
MLDYVLRLLILLPLIGGMAWGSLWLWKRVQPQLVQRTATARQIDIAEVTPLGAADRLMVVRFDNRNLLIGVSRGGIALLASSDEGDFDA